MVYLERANTDLLCLCRCSRSLVSSPQQMDCPWCGCGWLFTCLECRKAYAFARAVEVEKSLEEIAEIDIRRRWHREATGGEIVEWVEWMQILLKPLRVGNIYVYLDGFYIDTTQTNIVIEGWHAHHNLPYVPQIAALKDKSVLDKTLASRAYWDARAVNEEGER